MEVYFLDRGNNEEWWGVYWSNEVRIGLMRLSNAYRLKFNL